MYVEEYPSVVSDANGSKARKSTMIEQARLTIANVLMVTDVMKNSPMINSNLKYWKPRFLSFNYVPEMGGYSIGENIDDADVEMTMREIGIGESVWYKEIEPCVYDYLEICGKLILKYNDRIMYAKQMLADIEAEADILRDWPHEPGTPEYYRLNDISLKSKSLQELINHLKSSRNVAIAIRDEARDMAKELLEIYKTDKQ